MPRRDEVIVRSTHRGLRYCDGRMVEVLEPGRYRLPRRSPFVWRPPVVEIVQVDMREREITIKGQEILTADKVALRVSVITQFRVTDPVAAVESVATTRTGSTATCSWPRGARSRRCRWPRS